MGCGGSKVDELPLVTLCRERKQYIKAAAGHRYALSSAHLSYFLSLRDVGEALRRFVDEEIVFASSSSTPSSPVLTLPSDRGKKVKHIPTNPNNHNHKHNHNNDNDKSTSSSGSISHIHSLDDDNDDGHGHGHGHGHGRAHRDIDNSHLHLSSDSDSDSEESGHIHIRDDDYGGGGPRIRVATTYYPTAQSSWDSYPMNPQPPPYRDTNWNSYPMDPQPPPYQPDYGPPYGFNLQPPAYQPDYGPPYGFYPQPPAYQPDWDDYGGNANLYGYGTTSNSRAYYMKKSAPAMRTVIHEHEQRMFQGEGGGQRMGMDQQYFNSSGYSGYPKEGGGFFGFPMGGTPQREASERKQPSPAAAPPPPPAPQVSGWDFLNPFDAYDNGYPGYNTQSKYGYGSISSSPDSDEVREREGIPDLEEETESEAFHKETNKKNKLNAKKYFGEGTSRAAPQRAVSQKVSEEGDHSDSNEGNSARGMPAEISESPPKEAPWRKNEEATWQNSEATQPVHMNEEKSSPVNNVSKRMEEGYGRKKGVSFEIDEASMLDEESSKLSSLTTLSAHGTRDLQEVVNEIRDEFEIASGHGKEVAMMLEAGTLSYQPKFAVLKVVLARILYLVAPSPSSTRSMMQLVRLRSRVMKLARSYHPDSGTEANVKHHRLSSTLEKLYAWEKKLYREVKDEEKLRVIYEKMCKRLKVLDDRGAETSKIDATQASIQRLLTKLNVCIKAIDAISRRIQKLRDEELQPQVSELIHGLIRMWKSMLKCHQKQFQAILESKTRTLRANTGIGRDSSSRASLELENGLQTWCSHFSDWINSQKSYVESLNGWLLRCLDYEPEDTADGIIPFSPGRIGAPPIFVICNDWHQGMDGISEEAVANAMLTFASNLRQLWERQDEEQRQRMKAEYLIKDFEKRRKDLRTERGKMRHDHDAMSDKTGASIVASDSGVSPLDDLKVDLDSLRHKMDEERARHKDAIKLVNDAASSSLQGGIIPIFKALENFTSGALKVHEQVRLQNAGRG